MVAIIAIWYLLGLRRQEQPQRLLAKVRNGARMRHHRSRRAGRGLLAPPDAGSEPQEAARLAVSGARPCRETVQRSPGEIPAPLRSLSRENRARGRRCSPSVMRVGEVLGQFGPRPVLIQDVATDRVRRILTDDPEVLTWWATRVELASAPRSTRSRRERSPTRHTRMLASAGRVRRSVGRGGPHPNRSLSRPRAPRVHPLRARTPSN